MPKKSKEYRKFKRCVVKVRNRRKNRKTNPYAICRVSTKYSGSTKEPKKTSKSTSKPRKKKLFGIFEI